MPDRRSVDDLSIEELEQILRIKKREARMQRLERYEQTGRRRGDVPMPGDKDELSEAQGFTTVSEKPSPLRDNLLLGIEVLAALGLVVLLVYVARSLIQINEESAAAQAEEVSELPTAEPTPILGLVVLPGGHTPPTSPGGAQPNYSEVPAHLRPLVEQQFAGPVIIPTPAPGNAIRVRIPALDVDAPVVQGDGWEQLKKGVGQHIGTPDPGETGNMVLSAHNDVYGEIFRRLDELSPGDEIIVSTRTRDYTYRVADTRIVSPTSVEVMAPTREAVVTLISCYPYLVNTERIVVVAELGS